MPHSTADVQISTDVPAPPADPAGLAALADAGFDVVTLAGNHVYDVGEGVADTVAITPARPGWSRSGPA